MLFLCWGMALATLENTHIKVDVVINLIPERGKAIANIIQQIIGMAAVVIIVWQTFVAGIYAKKYQVTTAMLKIPDWPFYMMLMLSFAILGFSMIILIIRSVEVIRK